MTVSPNVIFTLDNPEAFWNGQHPLFPYPVRQIQLASFPSRADALSGINATILITFNLPPPHGPQPSDPWLGPFRYGYYHQAQTPLTWYAYRFISDANDISPWSTPWSPASHRTTSIRDAAYALPRYFGDLARVIRSASIAGASITAGELSDPALSPDAFLHWYAWRLDVDSPATYRIDGRSSPTTVTVSPTTGFTGTADIIISPIISYGIFIAAAASALEDMLIETRFDLPYTEDAFDAPMGVETPADILAVEGMFGPTPYTVNFLIEQTHPLRLRLRPQQPWHYIRLRALARADRVYGPPEDLSTQYQLPSSWLNAAVAYHIATLLVDQDPEDPFARSLLERITLKYQAERGRYAPEPQRPLNPNSRRAVLPGPRAI